MKIRVDEDVLGELENDGAIFTTDIWLKKYAALLVEIAIPYLDILSDGSAVYRQVKKGEDGYYHAVVNALLDAGYALE